MEIQKLGFGPIFLQVIIPAIIAFGAIFTVIAGYKNLESQIKTDKDLQVKAEKINHAFTKIEEQEEVLLNQKKELEKQQAITAKQQEFNKLLNQIQVLSLGSKNGSRKDFEEFYSLIEGDLLNSELQEVWEKEYLYLRKIWESELEEVNNFKLLYNKTKSSKKWSEEFIYYELSTLWTNRTKANNRDYIAYFNEIETGKSKNYVETLYKIATEGNNISYSILAAKVLCSITDNEPYPTNKYTDSYKQLLSDVPQFKKMKKWWLEKGNKNDVYSCPFDQLIQLDRNYFVYDRSHDGDEIERMDFLNNVIIKYPNLYRSKSELAYLKLGTSETYAEVLRLAKEAISGTDMEPLPFLLIASINHKQGYSKRAINNLRLAKQALSQEEILTIIRINPKLNDLFSLLVSNDLLDK